MSSLHEIESFIVRDVIHNLHVLTMISSRFTHTDKPEKNSQIP